MSEVSYGYASSHDSRNLKSDRYFQINNCGYLSNESNSLPSSKPGNEIRMDHTFIYVTEGNGLYYKGENGLKFSKGDLLYISPGDPLSFSFFGKASHYWIHFTGYACDDILKTADVTKTGVYHIGYKKKISELFSEISFRLAPFDNSSIFYCNGVFLQILSILTADFISLSNSVNNIESKILPALKSIHTKFFENHPLSYYADLCDMSLPSFKREFTKIAHIPPLTYINSIRIDKAKGLLISENKTISEIAVQIGFDDPQYFGRLFKKFTGTTPTEYRLTTSQQSEKEHNKNE